MFFLCIFLLFGLWWGFVLFLLFVIIGWKEILLLSFFILSFILRVNFFFGYFNDVLVQYFFEYFVCYFGGFLYKFKFFFVFLYFQFFYQYVEGIGIEVVVVVENFDELVSVYGVFD